MSDSARALTYENAPNIWLQARGKRMRFGQDPNFPAYSMKPEDINNFLWSMDLPKPTPDVLYNHPTETPFEVDYSTSAVNPDELDAALFVDRKPKSQLNQMRQYQESEDYVEMPQSMKALLPEAIYSHEVGHFYDPRANKKDSSMLFKANDVWNYDQNLKRGMSPQIASREAPAQSSEENFWKRKGIRFGIFALLFIGNFFYSNFCFAKDDVVEKYGSARRFICAYVPPHNAPWSKNIDYSKYGVKDVQNNH